MNIQLSIKPELEVRSRLIVLYYVVRELSEGFGASKSDLAIIKKGIFDKEIISKIYIYYLNESKELVGKVIIAIDWEKHYILASDENGKSFEIDTKKSICEQISELYNILIYHTKKIREALLVKEINFRYTYKSEIYNDENKLKEARKFLGLSIAEKDDIKWTEKKFDFKIEVQADRLNELNISIENKK